MNTDLMDWAVRQKAGSGIGKAILMLLAYHADENGEVIIQGNQLADEISCSRHSVRIWLRYLLERGLLKKRIVHRGSRRALAISLMMERAA